VLYMSSSLATTESGPPQTVDRFEMLLGQP
jgi:hypothetical protein